MELLFGAIAARSVRMPRNVLWRGKPGPATSYPISP